MFVMSGCGASKVDITVEQAPVYEGESSSEFIVKATEADEGVSGLTIQATLEMAKMDHGVIEVTFIDNGDGTYTSDVELPMAGEWIADVRADHNGKEIEEVLTFDVKER